MAHVSADSVIEFRDADGVGGLLFDRAQLPTADTALFDPINPTLAAQAVAGGGRGAAWFVTTPAGAAVLRHYRRGGWVARLSRDAYIFAGAERTRAFHEFRLLRALRERGLPAPAPLAAAFWRAGVCYRAALLVARIDGARSLGDQLRGGEAPDWAGIGRTIARFHRAGACHADLNVDNVLMDADGTHWLIDFDRGRLRQPAHGWQRANLSRLLRSIRKQLPARARADAIVAGWNELLAAHAAAMDARP